MIFISIPCAKLEAQSNRTLSSNLAVKHHLVLGYQKAMLNEENGAMDIFRGLDIITSYVVLMTSKLCSYGIKSVFSRGRDNVLVRLGVRFPIL